VFWLVPAYITAPLKNDDAYDFETPFLPRQPLKTTKTSNPMGQIG